MGVWCLQILCPGCLLCQWDLESRWWGNGSCSCCWLHHHVLHSCISFHFHPVSADDALALAVHLCRFVCVVAGVSRGAGEGRIFLQAFMLGVTCFLFFPSSDKWTSACSPSLGDGRNLRCSSYTNEGITQKRSFVCSLQLFGLPGFSQVKVYTTLPPAKFCLVSQWRSKIP